MNDQLIEQLFECYQNNNIDKKVYLCNKGIFDLLIDKNTLNMLSIYESFTNGNFSKIMNKSKSTIIYTSDRKYMMKYISKSEATVLNKMLYKYIKHITIQDSFFVPIYGLFKIRNFFRDHYVILMPNLCNGFVPTKIYDLKGREPKNKCCFMCYDDNSVTNSTITDDKLLYENIDDKILLNRPEYNIIIKTLLRDFGFLRENGIIDYSLLIAEYSTPCEQNHHIFRCTNGINDTEIKFLRIGIIDYLSKYTFRKKVANWFKSWRWYENQIATIEPQKYYDRICSFIQDKLFMQSG